jgi:uncharacterized membrane protein
MDVAYALNVGVHLAMLVLAVGIVLVLVGIGH